MTDKSNEYQVFIGSFNGYQKTEYTDQETGEIKISRRFKLQLIDEALSTEDEFATYELYFKIPSQGLEIPRMMPGAACRVTCQFKQDKTHENWRVTLVSVEAI